MLFLSPEILTLFKCATTISLRVENVSDIASLSFISLNTSQVGGEKGGLLMTTTGKNSFMLFFSAREDMNHSLTLYRQSELDILLGTAPWLVTSICYFRFHCNRAYGMLISLPSCTLLKCLQPNYLCPFNDFSLFLPETLGSLIYV